VTIRPRWSGHRALAGLWLCLVTLALGCNGGARSARNGEATVPSRSLLVVLPQGEASPVTAQLLEALGRYARVEAGRPTHRSPRSSRPRDKEIRAMLERARTLYLTMKMDSARQELQRALKLARQSLARGLSPDELAEIHLYLAAVSHAQRRTREVRLHCRAAAGFNPKLVPDPDVFSPPVRETFEKAKQERQTVEVVVRSEPAGAEATWDGAVRGPTPVTVAEQATGEHYLVVEHPLYQVWGERIRLSTSTQLEVKLERAEPPRVLAAVASNPELTAQGITLLGADGLLWLDEREDGLRMRVRASSGAERSFALPAESTPSKVDQTAQAIASHGGPAPAKPTPPKKEPKRSKWRRYWWAWILAGAVVVTTAVAVPLSLQNGEGDGRGAVLPLP
jgi:hypothetical protein